ncbi:MAG: MBL fold metallo-hydrolase [Pseudomonadota bacterium]
MLPIKWLAPHFVTEDGKLILSIHALVIETPTRKIIVDTCIGNDKQRSIPTWTNLQLPFLSDLAAAGYERQAIDTVLCTHLHVDHVGWNTMLIDGQWQPTFPNARYLIAESEYRYWDSQEGEGINLNVMDDSVRPVFEAGLVDLVDTRHKVCDEVSLVPTHGHTPGHVSIHIKSRGAEAIITGDAFHHSCQIAHTDWASTADFDEQASTRTRNDMLAAYGDRDILVIGTHFATPTAGHIKRTADGFMFEALPQP